MNEDPTMQLYQQYLKKLVDAGGGSQQFRQDQRKLQRTIRENQVYAVLCPDNEYYYRTIFLKKNFVGNLVPAISNAIMEWCLMGLMSSHQRQ